MTSWQSTINVIIDCDQPCPPYRWSPCPPQAATAPHPATPPTPFPYLLRPPPHPPFPVFPPSLARGGGRERRGPSLWWGRGGAAGWGAMTEGVVVAGEGATASGPPVKGRGWSGGQVSERRGAYEI